MLQHRPNISLRTDMTHHNQRISSVKRGRHGYRRFHLYASALTITSPGSVMEGSLPMSTNNNTASTHKLSPGEPVAKHGFQTLFLTAAALHQLHILVINKHLRGLYRSADLAAPQVPVTRMLTKARELSGAEDRHNERKKASSRKGGSRFSLTKCTSLTLHMAAGGTIPATMSK